MIEVFTFQISAGNIYMMTGCGLFELQCIKPDNRSEKKREGVWCMGLTVLVMSDYIRKSKYAALSTDVCVNQAMLYCYV